jgi:hypothetical protein
VPERGSFTGTPPPERLARNVAGTGCPLDLTERVSANHGYEAAHETAMFSGA